MQIKKSETKRPNISRTALVFLFVGTCAVVLVAILIFISTRAPSVDSETISNIPHGSLVVNGVDQDINDARIQASSGDKIEYTSAEVHTASSNAAVLSWKQSGASGITVEARTKDGFNWSGWLKLDTVDGGKDGSENTARASSLLLSDNIDRYQFRFTLTSTSDQKSDVVNVDSAEIETIDSRSIASYIQNSPFGFLVSKLGNAHTASAATAAPKIISRSSWGSPEPNHSSWRPEYKKLNRAIIHHTATDETSDSYADVRAIWHYHARSLGWGDIGYNYVVDSNGRIFQGRYFDEKYARSNRVDVVGGHAYNNNSGTTGISVLGNFDTKSLSGSARESVAQITAYKLAPYNINPTKSGAVIGHRDVYPTSCPGAGIVREMNAIRTIASSKYYGDYQKLTGFQDMNVARWMMVSNDVRKYFPYSRTFDGTVHKTGTYVRLVDKRSTDKGLCVRTASDASNGIDRCFLFEDMEEIAITYEDVPANEATRTVLTRTYKEGVATGSQSRSFPLPEAQQLTFTKKATARNQTFYITKHDANKGYAVGVPANSLHTSNEYEDIATTNLESSSTQMKVLPGSNVTWGSGIRADTKYTFSSRTMVDGLWHYRTQYDTERNLDRAISESELTLAVDPMKYPRWLDYSGADDEMRASPRVYIPFKTVQNGELYFLPSDNNLEKLYPASAFSSVQFISLLESRVFTVTKTTQKVRVDTSEVLSQTIRSGTKIRFGSEITVDGIRYIRTAHDTSKGYMSAIKASDLTE